MSELFFLIYTSITREPITHDFLQGILISAKKSNSREAISGMLSCRSNHFFQYLEGPQDKVLNCFERIQKDPRHFQIKQLGTGFIKHRRFEQWDMGYIDEPESKSEDLKSLWDLALSQDTNLDNTALFTILDQFSKDVSILSYKGDRGSSLKSKN